MSVFLNKLLPLPLLPLGIALILLGWAVWSKKRAPAILAMLVLWIASMPAVGDRLVEGLERMHARVEVEDCARADAVVVLGGFARQSNGSTPAHPEFAGGVERLERGLDLLAAGRADFVVLSNARIPWMSTASRTEGEFLREVVLLRGIDRSRVVLTENVQNTAGEALAVAELARRRGWGRVILVTSAFHLPRAMEQFERAGVNAVPFPCDWMKDPDRPLTVIDFLPAADALADTHLALREHYGRIFYAVRAVVTGAGRRSG